MDLTSKEFLKASTLFVSQQEEKMDGKNEFSKKNPFLDTHCDPLCKMNLKETSEFVKSFPLANNVTKSGICFEISERSSNSSKGLSSVTKRNVEAPPTPGRPVFNFSNGNFLRKNCPSKWDDAEKWVINGSDCSALNSKMYSKQCSGYNKPQLVQEVFAEKSKVTEEKVSTFQGPFVLEPHNSTRAVNGVSLSTSTEVLLKDKFPNPKFGCSEPMQEGFLFESAIVKSMNGATIERVQNVKHKDVGTEMTPLASSTTSRCPTPLKSTSPARHNTPYNRSGPLANSCSNSIDVTKLEQFDFGKMHLRSQYDSAMSNWSSREEEEDDASKSLRHSEISGEFRKSVSDSRCAWEEEEKNKSFLRYEREEAKIQDWVNLQSAKAEAESRKLEVKIQKMRYDLEEKLMKRMADVQRKAEEWRAAAQFNHSEQIRKVNQRARKAINKNNTHLSVNKSCGCFPCNNHL